MKLELDKNEVSALLTALDTYLNGIGMESEDEDEIILDKIVTTLSEMERS
jgi:hypothetical protein